MLNLIAWVEEGGFKVGRCIWGYNKSNYKFW
jgi:hypothetical protein